MAVVLVLLAGCTSKRDIGNLPEGSGGSGGPGDAGSGAGGRGGHAGSASGVGGDGSGGVGGRIAGVAGGGPGGSVGAAGTAGGGTTGSAGTGAGGTTGSAGTGAGGTTGSGGTSGTGGSSGTGGNSGTGGDSGTGGAAGRGGTGGAGGTAGSGGGGAGGAGGRGGAGGTGGASANVEYQACPSDSRVVVYRSDLTARTCTVLTFQMTFPCINVISGGWCLGQAVVSPNVAACDNRTIPTGAVAATGASGTFSIATGVSGTIVNIDISLQFPASGTLPQTVQAQVATCYADCRPRCNIPNPALQSGLARLYKLDEMSGNSVADSSVNGRNGAITRVGSGGALFSTTHRVGTGALNLMSTDNANGAYVVIPPLDSADLYAGVTIAAWVNITTNRAGAKVFDFNGTTTGPTSYMSLTTNSLAASNTVRFTIAARNQEQSIESNARLFTGTWHHLAVVLYASSTGLLYVDGARAGINQSLSVGPLDIFASNHWIGRSVSDADPYFDGHVDDFRVYSRPLSDDEIVDLYRLR
jgi:hypothetical protein